MISSPACGGKRRKHSRRQLRGDWRLFNVLVDHMERRVLGFTVRVVQPGVTKTCGKKFLKVPSYSDFSHHIWTAPWEDARTSFLSSSSCWFLFWSCWTKIAHLNMPEKHSHTRLSIISLGILPVLQPQVECTCGGARRISRSSARGAPRPATMEAVIKCKVQSIILCWFAKEPAVSLTAKLRLDEVCRLFGFINRNHARQYKSTGLSTIQSVIQLYGCTVWWLSLVWTIYTPFVCKKGIMMGQWYLDHGNGVGLVLFFFAF